MMRGRLRVDGYVRYRRRNAMEGRWKRSGCRSRDLATVLCEDWGCPMLAPLLWVGA